MFNTQQNDLDLLTNSTLEILDFKCTVLLNVAMNHLYFSSLT